MGLDEPALRSPAQRAYDSGLRQRNARTLRRTPWDLQTRTIAYAVRPIGCTLPLASKVHTRSGRSMQPRVSFSPYPGTELIVGVKDILGAPTDVIVNPANGGLSYGGGLAAMIADAAGESMLEECDDIIRKQGRVPKNHAVLTSAGRLPYRGIIHAVGPKMGEGDEANKLKATILNALQLALEHQLRSVAFPAISSGIYGMPKPLCAQAFAAAFMDFWRDESHRDIKLVWLCLIVDDYPIFRDIMAAKLK